MTFADEKEIQDLSSERTRRLQEFIRLQSLTDFILQRTQDLLNDGEALYRKVSDPVKQAEILAEKKRFIDGLMVRLR